MESLKEIVAPAIQWLKDNGNPHTRIVVTMDRVLITEDVCSLPVNDDKFITNDQEVVL